MDSLASSHSLHSLYGRRYHNLPLEIIMRYLIATLLLTLAFAAQADTLYLHGVTSHYVACDEPCNETNIGMSYKHDLGDNRFAHVGAFENSQYNTAGFAAYGWSRKVYGIEFGAAAGVAVGYVERMGYTDAGVVPIGILSAEVGPVYAAVIPGAVTAAVRVPLD